jgi:hypothetical protein
MCVIIKAVTTPVKTLKIKEPGSTPLIYRPSTPLLSLRAKRSKLSIKSPLLPLYKRGKLSFSLSKRETERDFKNGGIK